MKHKGHYTELLDDLGMGVTSVKKKKKKKKKGCMQ